MRKFALVIFLFLFVVPVKNVAALPLVENGVDCGGLDEKAGAELNELASFFERGTMELLKKRLNDEVLLSYEQLQEELKKLESYTCLEYESAEKSAMHKIRDVSVDVKLY